MGSSGSKQSSQGTSEPWKGQQPYLKDIYARAQETSQTPLEYYPESTVASRDPLTTAGIQAAAGRGPISDTTRAASAYTGDVLSGRYLDPSSNPHLRETYRQASDALGEDYNRIVQPGLRTATARAGRGGGVLDHQQMVAQDQLSDQLGTLANQIYGGAYAGERGLMEAARAGAPAAAGAEAADIASYTGAGLMNEEYSQRVLQDLIDRFNFAQDEENIRLGRYAGLIGSPVTQSQQSGRGMMSEWHLI